MTGARIAIVGSGANGSSIGADLIRAGEDVTLIDQWPAHVEKMRRDGLRIVMPEETLEVEPRALHLCEVAELTEPFDAVLILVKAYDARWAAQLIEPYVAADGFAVAVQNGMTADIVADVVGVERATGCVIEISSVIEEPGVVQRHSGPARSWFGVGSLGGPSRHDDLLAELLENVGTVTRFDDIRSAKWMKLVSNVSTIATTAILGVPAMEAMRQPGMRELALACGREAVLLGELKGHQVLPIFGLEQADIADPERTVEVMLDTLFAGFLIESTTTTAAHDWGKGRRSESDAINGIVVAEGERLDLPTPANSAVLEVARRIDRRELAPGVENLALMLDLAGDAL
jgi:2-dehydropantoate 2-reductase